MNRRFTAAFPLAAILRGGFFSSLLFLCWQPIMPRLSAADSAADIALGNDPLWEAVKGAMNEGRPQTAIERLEPIIRRAAESKNFPESIRALTLKLELEAASQPDAPADKLKKMRAAIDAAPEPLRPVMEAIQAKWMWDFFQQHRWQFAQRTAVAAPASLPANDQVSQEEPAPPLPGPDDDPMTWDLARILQMIDGQFARALRAAKTLQQVPARDYKILLSESNVGDEYRPTMYDVLVHQALEFYSAGEQAGSKGIDAFELSADSPIFATTEEFLAWEPAKGAAAESPRPPHRVAVSLYQELLRFHAADQDPTARLDADLARLEFGNNHAVGEEKSARFQAALQRFDQAHADHPISTRATHQLAMLRHQEGDWVEAHRVASQALARFPESVGANRCFNLIKQIEAREASASTERVWNDPWPTIDVRYRNVNRIHFKLFRTDPTQFPRSGRWEAEHLDQKSFQNILAGSPAKSWSADLPATPDYQNRVESLPVPKDLKPGAYLLFTSHNEAFSEADNQLSVAEVWVSKLAIITRTEQGRGTIGGFVLDAKAGTPIAGATIRGWQADPRNGTLTEIPSVKTDPQGRFQFPSQQRDRLWLLASHQDQQLSSANYLGSYLNNFEPPRGEQTNFFTDRAIYRPGQTIRYKGICYSFDQKSDDYRVIPKRPVTVVLRDANGQEVERQQHAANDYGSFSGSFTAPRDRLAGQMSIHVEGDPPGQTFIRVEEYKRPKFEVTIEPPAEAPKLDAEVNLVGSAKAYTGANIDNADVRWRVVREVRFPPWWFWRCWWLPPMPTESQEIAQGTAKTTADGTFPIRFVAKPDRSVDPQSEPTFHYTIYADVTDGAGETRSGSRSVSAGFAALTASITADEWLPTGKPVEFTIRTTTLDSDGQAAEGTLTIHALRQPDSVARPKLEGFGYVPMPRPPMPRPIRGAAGRPGIPPIDDQPSTDPSNPNSWELGDVVATSDFRTDGSGNQKVSLDLPAGIYRAILKTRDRFGKEVSALLPLEVFDPAAKSWPVKLPHRLRIEKSTVQPGQTLRVVWSSGYDTARVLFEAEHRGKVIRSETSPAGVTQATFELPVTEAMRGGFTIHTLMVRDNRAYLQSHRIDVPWTNKELDIRWERFTSKLEPAASEKWTAVISGKDAEKAAAEMVATLYDASLDAFVPHPWSSGFGIFRQDQSMLSQAFENRLKGLNPVWHSWRIESRDDSLNYPRLDWPPGQGHPEMMYRRGRVMLGRGMPMAMEAMPMAAGAPAPAAMAADADFAGMGGMGGGQMMAKGAVANARFAEGEGGPLGGTPPAPNVNLEGVTARTNLNETAFFFPHLIAGADGVVRLEFTMPEALTRWNFRGFAHDTNLRAGLLSDSIVTSKDLMVQPNAPRFLREGDAIEFTVKVTNRSATRQTGSAALKFFDPRTNDPIDAALGNITDPQSFDTPAGESRTLAWRIRVPDGLNLVTYRAVASSGRVSDGEEGILPILSRRILVTESLPLPLRGPQTKAFDFARLAKSADSDTLRHQSLTVQMASNPAWYAVMALPYLMEYPHQCSEQIFNRLYANSLARKIATSDPKIEKVFAQWRGTKALDSPLSKNEELRAVLLQESPWVRQADDESQARRNVGILFDTNRLNDETSRAMSELVAQQNEDGRWPWFPGGPANDYITLYITTGFGRLRHLGVPVDAQPAIRSLPRLDAWMAQQHRDILEQLKKEGKDEPPKDAVYLSHTIALYLYGRSFFLDDHAVAPEHADSLRFWVDQAKRHWLKLDSLQCQAQLAVALHRLREADAARAIVVSLKQRSLSNDELGTYWPVARDGYWWYRAPIETQAMLIEAFDEVAADPAMVEACQVWLLKQKQTQDWKTTKATADAVYALLLRGSDRLASDQLVEVSLGDLTVKPEQVEAGTGFFEQRIPVDQIKPALARVTAKKSDPGVAWGSVHWQYFEDIGKITADASTPLKLTKELYVKRLTNAGPVLQRIGEGGPAQANVGDELVVRIVLKSDRDLEYVHLRDHRGSGTEPVNVLSGYRFQDGLGYYESTRDAASHFFIDYLRAGTYVFEYSTRVQLRGEYQTGMASIECMYAPEFRGHSQSIPLVVKGD
jgi:uncharacterized protein YfaS (alpha-2-macroglobulin family)/tetratricopeptide (TPR) repeat protein